MKKISTVAAKQTKNFREQKLTIGLDLGDRSSWSCVLDEAGEVLLEQRLSTTPKAYERSVRRNAGLFAKFFSSKCHRGTP
jgi:Ethanolamine utilization protein EutJ (predicted chaperonin)